MALFFVSFISSFTILSKISSCLLAEQGAFLRSALPLTHVFPTYCRLLRMPLHVWNNLNHPDLDYLLANHQGSKSKVSQTS